MAGEGKLGGLKRRQIIRELAAQEVNQSALAIKYGVSTSAITQFKQRHAEEIAAVRADMDNEFAGILIANKAARLAALVDLYEAATTPTPKISVKGDVVRRMNPETGEFEEVMEIDARAAMQALKQAAEEMGQLPTRVQVSGGMDIRTNYTIEGVSPDDLR